MFWKLFAPVMVMALALAWLLPSNGEGPGDPVSEAAQKAPEAQPAVNGTDEPVYGAVELARQPNGHFYANADVDGTEIRFLVDTGASTIALSASDARALGLDWADDELRLVGRGVNGAVFGKPVQLGSISVGDVEAANVDAVIIPNGLDVSLLGQSFLSRVDNVVIEGDRMTLN